MKLLICLALTIIIGQSCTGHRSYAKFDGGVSDGGYGPDGGYGAMAFEMDNSDKIVDEGQSASITPKRESMMIYNSSVSLKVKNADTVSNRLSGIATKYGGYVVSSGTTYASIRVKSENLTAALAEVSELGKVLSKNTYGEDVSLQYNDYNIRLENALKARERYLELLAKAENVSAALLVEKELERLNTEIDVFKGMMNQFEHNERYSLISVNIDQKKKLGVLGYVCVGVWKGVKWLFVRG